MNFENITGSLKANQALFVLGYKPNNKIGIVFNHRINKNDILGVLRSRCIRKGVPRFHDVHWIGQFGLRKMSYHGFKHMAFFIYEQTEDVCLCFYILSEDEISEPHLRFYAMKTGRLLNEN